MRLLGEDLDGPLDRRAVIPEYRFRVQIERRRQRFDLSPQRINDLLVLADRERVGREAFPSAAVVESWGVRTKESGGRRGYDAVKR